MEGHVALGELTAHTTRGVTLIAPGDDAEVRALMRRSVIPGAVRVAFTREPSYFAAEGLAGARDYTVVARHDGRVVGVGRCSIHALHRNGVEQRVGYLGELRLTDGVPRGVRLLRDGYEELADALADEGVDAFFTSVTADNARARAVLERGGRIGLPRYEPIAKLVTLVAPVRQSRARDEAEHIDGIGASSVDAQGAHVRQSVRNGRPPRNPVDHTRRAESRDALTVFLNEHSRASHLGLTWSADRWSALAMHGISADDFVVVRQRGTVVGAASVWDQRPFRQVVIDGYEGVLRMARPLANAVQALRRQGTLPSPGSVLAQGAVLGAYVTQPDVWPSLWSALEHRAAAQGLSWLSISRDSRDPELVTLQRLLGARPYHTHLYDVALGRTIRQRTAWDTRLVRPEVGLL